MKVFIWIVLIIITIYTFGFSFSLWRDKNKLGAIAVFILTAGTVASAFLRVLK